jgi:chorismate-pyruvate lyase
LRREHAADTYLREVVLRLDAGQPAEYGVICIHLRHFPDSIRRMILAEQLPFGRILHEHGLLCVNRPQAFFRVTSDAHMSSVFRLPRGEVLYGRRNVLMDGARRLYAQVIEILAPIHSAYDQTPQQNSL